MSTPTIYKYPLEIVDIQTFEVPGRCQYLTAQYQSETLFIWIAVYPGEKSVVSIRIVGNDYPFPAADNCDYIATVQEEQFVWHIFAEHQTKGAG